MNVVSGASRAWLHGFLTLCGSVLSTYHVTALNCELQRITIVAWATVNRLINQLSLTRSNASRQHAASAMKRTNPCPIRSVYNDVMPLCQAAIKRPRRPATSEINKFVVRPRLSPSAHP